MKNNLTLITMILDRSGSMEDCREGTIEGFNAFIDSQKKTQEELNDEVNVSLIQFDDRYEVNYNMLPLQNVPKLTKLSFVPRGGTALNDAIGRTIVEVGSTLAATPEENRPSKVLVVILTDGQENQSREYSRERIAEMIRHQESKYAWEFMYIGANQDSFAVGATMGVKFANTMNYTSSNVGTRSAFASMSKTSSLYRSTGKVDVEQP